MPRCFVVKNASNAFSRDVVGHARPAIGDGDAAAPVRVGDRDVDPSLPVHRLRGVHQDVLKHDLQHFAIADDIARRR